MARKHQKSIGRRGPQLIGHQTAEHQPMLADRVARPDAAYAELRTSTQRVAAVKELKVYCWCGKKQIKVAQAEVRAGRTDSCGREGCESP
jgi:hypothetical protein